MFISERFLELVLLLPHGGHVAPALLLPLLVLILEVPVGALRRPLLEPLREPAVSVTAMSPSESGLRDVAITIMTTSTYRDAK